ncbi:MAG: hypothetical protein ORN98_06420, partial [Alphaproteobacteria bacterium]|nr:hypothetical protein [Alphaproteobacteria bacterium]
TIVLAVAAMGSLLLGRHGLQRSHGLSDQFFHRIGFRFSSVRIPCNAAIAERAGKFRAIKLHLIIAQLVAAPSR